MNKAKVIKMEDIIMIIDGYKNTIHITRQGKYINVCNPSTM